MLTIRVIGGLRAEHDGRAIDLPAHGRAAALLGWLALHPGHQPRARPAGALWPDAPEAAARANLRSAAWALRAALGPAGALLVADRATLGLAGEGVSVDVWEVERLASEGQREKAAALCGGELLAGFDEDWALEARDEFAGLVARLGDAAGGRVGEIPVPTRAALIGRDAEFRRLTECWRSAAAGRGQTVLLSGVGGIGKTRLGEELAAAVLASGGAVAAGTAGGMGAPDAHASDSAETLRTAGVEERRTRSPATADAAHRRAADPAMHPADRAGPITRAAASAASAAPADLPMQSADPADPTTPPSASAPPDRPRPLLTVPPLTVWTEALTDLVATAGPVPPSDPWAADLARVVPAAAPGVGRRASRAEPGLEQVRLFEAVLGFVARAARRRPLLLVLEDLHLADPSSLELVGFAARRVARLPVLLLLTSRDRPVLRVPHTELYLKELSPDDLRRIAAATAELPDEVVAQIAEAAGGSPLLAVEAALACARGLDPRGGLAEAAHAAVDRLSGPARLLVELIAVGGRDVSAAELRVFPVKDTEHAAAEAADLLRARSGWLGFRHALVGEAVYRQLREAGRARLHEMFAEILRRGADGHRAAETARHLRLAGLDGPAVAQLARAAADARGTAALAEAAGFLREAADIATHDPALLLELAEVEAWRGRPAESDAAFAHALELIPATDDDALIDAWLRRGRWMRGGLCYPRESKRSYRSALDVLDRRADVFGDGYADAGADRSGRTADREPAAGRDPTAARAEAAAHPSRRTTAPEPRTAARAEALAGLAWAESVAGDPARVDPLLRRIDALVGRRSPPDDLLTHDIGIARAHALIRSGRFADSYAPLIAASAAAGRAGRPDMAYTCLINAASAAACLGDFDRALDFAERCLPLVEPNGLLRLAVYVHSARGAVLRRLGRLREAAGCCDREEALAARLGQPEIEGLARYDRGLLAAARGDHVSAADLFAAALDLDAPVSRPHARLSRAEALARAARVEEAERELRATTAEPVAPGDFPDILVARLTRIQGLVAAARNDPATARRRFDEAAALWRRRSPSGVGDHYVAALIDLGRPPMTLLAEPDVELAGIAADLADLDRATHQEA